MSLYIYKGEWNIASIDYECLCTLAFIRLVKFPVNVVTNGSTFWSPNGRFPYLVTDDDKKIAGYSNIIGYLKSINYELAGSRSDVVGSDEAYVEVLKKDLLPYYYYSCWCPQSHDYSRSLYALRIKFPYNFITPKSHYNRADEMMKHHADFSLEEPVIKHNTSTMAINATRTLNWLEEKLKENKWVNGNTTPSLIDCHVYSLVALVAKNNVPFTHLQNHVKQCPNILKYIDRFGQYVLPKDGFCSPTKDTKQAGNSESEEPKNGTNKTFYTGQEDEEDPRAVRKRYILSGLVATVCMLAYSVIKGIVSVSYDSDQMDYMDDVLASEDMNDEGPDD